MSSNKRLINSDQKLWQHYQLDNAEVFTVGHPRQDKLYKKICKKVSKGGKILEIGFGDGYLLKKMSRNYQCFGADIAEKVIQEARNKFKNIDFNLIKTNGRLPYARDFFDALVASEVLEHMDDKELRIAIQEIQRTVKKNGFIFLTFPTDENLEDNMCFCPHCGAKFHKWGHKQSWNDKKVRAVFKNFAIVVPEQIFAAFSIRFSS